MKAELISFIRGEEGQGMTEYGLIIALVAIVVIGALVALGGNIKSVFTNASDEIAKPR